MPKIRISSSKITSWSLQSFISNNFHQGLQSLLDQATHWLADIPKIIFAKTPLELDYTDKNFWTAHFTAEIESLKAELLEGLILKKELQDRLVELQGIIGKHTLSPVVYYQGLLGLRTFSVAHKKLTSHVDAVTNVLQDFEAALHEQAALVRECFEGDSQLWLRQLVQPSREVYVHVTHALVNYQRFTVLGVYLSLLLQLHQQAVATEQTALIRNLRVMIFALGRQGIQPIEKDQEVQVIEDEESYELLRMNEKESVTKSAEKKDFLHSVFNTMKSWGEYVLNHPGQAVTLGLAAQAAAAAALESSLATKRSNQDRTLIEDMQQAAQQVQFHKLGQALATGLASAQVTLDPGIHLPTRQVNAQLRNVRAILTDNKGGTGTAPAVAGLNQGGFVITWQLNATGGAQYEGAHDNIYGAQYNDAGSQLSNEFQLNNFTAYTQAAPVVAGLNGEGFAVTWQSFNQTIDPGCKVQCWDVYARLYNISTTIPPIPTSNEFLVNVNYTIGDQSQPAIASLRNGGFVVGWQSAMNGTYHVYAQRYSDTAAPLENGFMVNTYNGYQTRSAIAGLNNGGFVITWQSFGQVVANFSSIFVRQFNISGSPLGIETWVDFANDGFIYQGTNPAVASLQDGGFIITWQSTENGGVYGRQYNASGSPLGGQFQVNIDANSTSDPSVAGLNNGGFVVAWNSYNQTGNGFFDIYAREYNASSNPIAGECLINNNTMGNQMYPAVASLNNGNFVIAWQNDQSYYGSYNQIFQPGFSMNNCTGVSSTSATTASSTTSASTTSALTTTTASSAATVASIGTTTGTTNPTSAISSTTTVTSSMNGIAATTVLGTTTATTSESTTSIALATTATSSATTAASIGTTTNPSSSTTGTANPTAATSVSNTVSTTAGIITAIGSTTSIETLATSGLPNVGSSTSNNSQSKNNTIGIAVGAAGGGIIIASAIALGIWKCKQKAKNYSRQSEQRQDEPGTSLSNLKTVDAY
jgi:hypothetical protein